MSKKKYERRYGKRTPNRRKKTPYEKRRTHEEVQEIKKNLINFASTKWGKAWINSLLERGRPFRMQRGIRYAEDEERIGNLTIHKGNIFATVQGTAPLPYRVKINFEIIPKSGWDKILKDLKSKLMNFIQLLDGELPDDIVKIFRKHEFPLFPHLITQENAECTCPDTAVPCKHIAAVILYISRVLDYDPFILLKLRGKEKDELLSELRLKEGSESSQANINGEKKDLDLEEALFKYNIPVIHNKELSAREENEKKEEFVGFNIKKPTKINETLENLGNPPKVENPRAFRKVIETIYNIVRKETYKRALKIESHKKNT
ncbi:MAG: SWIM zinc finger protein [Promethearchaeota archaeon]|nr:MAG: SWIM zinc finger protein [Candidatus Lokiarchaeota archaeon]